jgi:hypothetical protein
MSVKAYFDVVKIFAYKNIFALLRGVQNDMPLVMVELSGQIPPLPENKIGKRVPFPDADDPGIAKIDDQIRHREQRHLLADPDADNLAVKRKVDGVVDGESRLPVSDCSSKTFHVSPVSFSNQNRSLQALSNQSYGPGEDNNASINK